MTETDTMNMLRNHARSHKSRRWSTIPLLAAVMLSTLSSGAFAGKVSVAESSPAIRIGEAKYLSDGETVTISNVPVTIGWLEDPTTLKVYIQEWDRSSGIAIRLAASMEPDDDISALSLTGTMATRDGERYVDVSEIYWAYGEEPDIRPIGTCNLSGYKGLDISALNVTTWGRVIEVPAYDPGVRLDWFRVSDASGTIKVWWPEDYGDLDDNRMLVPMMASHLRITGVLSGTSGEKLLCYEADYEVDALGSHIDGSSCFGWASIEDADGQATSVAISGPGIEGWKAMQPRVDGEYDEISWGYWWSIPTPRPATPAQYLFKITENGQDSIYKGWLTAYLTELPTNLSPSSDNHLSGPLIFSWTLPSAGGPFESRITLRSDGELYDFWSEDGIRGTSYTYDGPPLSGHYSWRVEVFDRDGNSCVSERASFYYDPVLPLP